MAISPAGSPLRGLALCSLGEYEHALHDLDHALALRSENPQAYAARGHVYLEMGDIERARADFRRSREQGSQDDTVSFLIEWIALCQECPVSEHAVRLEALAATSHDPALALLCRGIAAVVRKQYEQAITELEQAGPFKPREGAIPFWKSMAFAFLGHNEEAGAVLQQAMTAEPPLSAALLTPLRWLEQSQPAFYKQYAAPLLASDPVRSSSEPPQENTEQGQ